MFNHPYWFFWTFTFAMIAMGAVLDRIFVGWRVRRLKEKIEWLNLWSKR